MNEQVPSSFDQREDSMFYEVRALFDEYHVEHIFQKNNSPTLRHTFESLLHFMPETVPEPFICRLRSLAIVWADRGDCMEAIMILKQLRLPTDNIYNIAKRKSGDRFGSTLAEHLLVCEHGSPEEIDRSIVDCYAGKDFSAYPHFKVLTCIEEVRHNLQGTYPRDLKLKGPELFLTHDLIEKYDSIVGVAHASVAIPIIATVLGHQNASIIEYHRSWKTKKPQWIRPPLRQASKVLISENDAATGKTLKKVIPVVLDRYKANVVDVLFTGECSQHSMEVAKSIPNIGQVYNLEMFSTVNGYTRICEVRDALRQCIESHGKAAASQ